MNEPLPVKYDRTLITQNSLTILVYWSDLMPPRYEVVHQFAVDKGLGMYKNECLS